MKNSCRKEIETKMIYGAPLGIAKAHSEPNQTSTKNVSVKTAIGLKLLTVFASGSTPDGWVWLDWALNTPLDVIEYKTFVKPNVT